jgi:ABC-type lipoprotein release transport system permease subunit
VRYRCRERDLIFSLALAVSLGPALRAARVDLAQVLRQQ